MNTQQLEINERTFKETVKSLFRAISDQNQIFNEMFIRPSHVCLICTYFQASQSYMMYIRKGLQNRSFPQI